MKSKSSNLKFNTIIIGLGRSGEGLHLPILHKISESLKEKSPFGKIIGLIDTDQKNINKCVKRLTDFYEYDISTIKTSNSIKELTGIDKDTTIVHICTPSKNHLTSLLSTAEAGYKNIVMEKPCADTVADVDEMIRVSEKYDLNVGVVNPYLYSLSVEKCKQTIIRTRSLLRYFEFELSKPRKEPSLMRRSSPDSVFDVELPHQIATALFVTETKYYRLLRAEVRDMHYRIENKPCIIIHNMGMCLLVLQLDQCIAVLVSYLDAPTRIRVMKLRFTNKMEINSFFPVSEDDHTAQTVEYRSNKRGISEQHSKSKYVDDLFTRCLTDIYLKFVKKQKHVSNLKFNRQVVDIMDQAKIMAKIRLP